MASLSPWQHQPWRSDHCQVPRSGTQPPAPKLSKHPRIFFTQCATYWLLTNNGSVSSRLMKYSLSLSFRYHDLYQAKQNPDKSFKSKHELSGLRHGLHFPYSAALWKAKKFCIMQMLARTFDTTCSESFCHLFPPTSVVQGRQQPEHAAQAGQRGVFRQRNLQKRAGK